MIIDHIGVAVEDTERSKAFYCRALAPLGIGYIMEANGWAGLGRNGKPEFWFGPDPGKRRPTHIAFRADTRAQVRAFHAAAIAAGATDDRPPGVHETYFPHYYGAFVVDPDGNSVEAVCNSPEA